MEHVRLGSSGLMVSRLALGTDNLLNPTPLEESLALIDAAVEGGINLIDTSDSYAAGEAERVVGEALRRSGLRDRVLVATKAYYPTGLGPNDRGTSRAHLIAACEASLRRLGVDHIDLYQTHRPDFDVPLEETLGALDDLVRAGKVRYVGSSTAPAWHVVESVMTSRARGLTAIVSEQSPYNLLDRWVERELVPACVRHGVGLLAWSPLAMGMLAGRYAGGDIRADGTRAQLRGGIYAERVTAEAVEVGNRFAALAREHGHEPAALAAGWVAEQPQVAAAIVGPRTVPQLETLLPAADLRLDDALRAACDALVPPRGAIADFFNSAGW